MKLEAASRTVSLAFISFDERRRRQLLNMKTFADFFRSSIFFCDIDNAEDKARISVDTSKPYQREVIVRNVVISGILHLLLLYSLWLMVTSAKMSTTIFCETH